MAVRQMALKQRSFEIE